MRNVSQPALDPARAIRGSCLCGSVEFAVAPPYAWFANCHCSMCRKHHGALFGSGLGVKRERFAWLAGTSEIVRYRATSAFERPFCRRCGSTLPGVSHDPDVLHVPAGLLERLNAAPRTHIFVGSKSPLTVIADELPQHAAYPPGVRLAAVAIRRPPTSAGHTEGSCLCAAVAYRIDAPLERLEHCGCGSCRKRTGSPYATSALVPARNVRWLRGAGLVSVYRGAARGYATAFCAHCGGLVPVAGARNGAATVAVPAGALDTIADVRGGMTPAAASARGAAAIVA